MENKKLFMDGMGIKSMLWMGAMGIAFVNADAVDNLTGNAAWQKKTCKVKEGWEEYCGTKGYAYYEGDCKGESGGFVTDTYKFCAYAKAVKLAEYALKGKTGEDEVKMLKEKCVAKSTNKEGYNYAYYSCKEYTYGYMDKTTFTDTCAPQLEMTVGGEDDYGMWSYDLCSLHGGAVADKTYGEGGALALADKLVKQARDAKQQVTNDEAKNKEEAKEVKEAKEGRLHVYECSDAIKKKEAKDIYFCFVKDAGDRFFDDIKSDWKGKHTVTIEKKELDGTKSTLEEIEIEVWDKCEDVTDSCGRTTNKNVEYFTKDEKYVLLKKGAEKKDDDSKGDDVKSKKTLTYEDVEQFKYDLAVKDIIAECTTKPNDPVCQIVLHKDFEGAVQDIRKEVANEAAKKISEAANEAAKKISEEVNEAAKKREEEEIERLQRTADYYKEKIDEHEEYQELAEERKELEALEKNIMLEESEQKLNERQRLINLEKYGAGMNKAAPVVETSSQ